MSGSSQYLTPMTTKPASNPPEFYLEVSITNALLGLNATPAVKPRDATPSLWDISKALHDVADQMLEGAPIGHTAVSDRYVANWQFSGTFDNPGLPEGQPAPQSMREPNPELEGDGERDTRPFDEFEESEITHVSGFRIPDPQPVAKASRKKNARPIYRYMPFKPGSLAGEGSWQAAARALNVFAVLHAAHRGPEKLKVKDLRPLFFRSSSDLITYREGWKAGRFWSVEAFKKAVCAREKHTGGLISEHVMPRSQTLMRALKIEDAGEAAEFVWNSSFECVVTSAENNELTRQDVTRPRSEIWLFENGPWQRYAGTTIRILDVACSGQRWLTPEDRETLQSLDLLAEWDASLLNHADPEILAQWGTYVPVEKR
ncbi:hypothetical protein [Acidovorax sp. BLS4]|uniref:hypothetical protein n=1 Tax=Acidovorax sp. BLS4 TaxID=3273430 RepID=UPI0029430819|nr:hypothetical protein [Paracidovorax avenae]WOI47885.1 hypothetical protein R1Z03_11995 [Paracidovorax avenae]